MPEKIEHSDNDLENDILSECESEKLKIFDNKQTDFLDLFYTIFL